MPAPSPPPPQRYITHRSHVATRCPLYRLLSNVRQTFVSPSFRIICVSMKGLLFHLRTDFLPTVRVGKNLVTNLGSRRGNAGNFKEYTVLTLIHTVP
ncbi:uncharacterized protein LOC124352683 [Homalodisca vitripennis]|uniref:uncharacterized protein LOC124352683 n=1 Tax=Homalodisca vitripennis TaxID=197043 RepID=UPI001EECEC5F|nr:uncharacterized protein LOC124352683 [Homalodisca vitripennis]KAG8287736.1 hypothetical protein J6590_031850 [Homalodisca vitripennis]